MKQTSLFRSLFSFRKKEIDAAFASAEKFASCYGIKVLRSSHALEHCHPGLSRVQNKEKLLSGFSTSENDKGQAREDIAPQHARFIIIPTRGWPNAPKRNRLRRQIKAIIFEEKLYEVAGSRIGVREDGSPGAPTYILLLYPVAKDLDRTTVRKFLCEAFNR